MDELDPLDHLDSNHEGGLEIELAANVDINIFQRLAEQIHHHHIVLFLTAAVVHPRDTVICHGVVAGKTI